MTELAQDRLRGRCAPRVAATLHETLHERGVHPGGRVERVRPAVEVPGQVGTR